MPESIQPSSQSVMTTSNTNPNVPSNVNVICGPALSATEQQPSVSNPTVLNPPFISGPNQVDSASIPTPPTVPPTSGINNTQSGSTACAVNSSLNNNAIGGNSFPNSNPENSSLFMTCPAPSNSTVPQNNELPSDDVPTIKPSTSVTQSPKSQTSSAPLPRPPKPNSPALKPMSSSPITSFTPNHIPVVNSSSISIPTSTPVPALPQDAELSISMPPTPPIPPTPLSSFSAADATADATAAPNIPKNISIILPPTSGINNTQSGSISCSVNSSLNNNAIGGISSTNSNPENISLFMPNPVLLDSTVPQNNEISLNGDNNHSQPSNASGDSISPPPVEKGTGREMNEKYRNQAPENPAYIDRSGVSEDVAPNPPTICSLTLNENDGNVPTQHKSEDESDHQDQDAENDSDDNCKKGCTCY